MAAIFWRQWNPRWLSEGAPYLQALTNVLIFLSLLLVLASQMWRRHQVSKAERPESGWLSPTLFYLAFLGHLAVIAGAVLIVMSVVHGNFGSSLVGRILAWLQSIFLGPITWLLGPMPSHALEGFFSWPGWVW